MIACRSLIRVDRAWKFTNTYIISKPTQYLQRCCFYHGLNFDWKMDGAKVMQKLKDPKKQKTATPAWRSVRTQSSSGKEVGGQTEEVDNISRGVSNAQRAHGEAEVLNEPIAPSFSSTALQDSDEGRAPEGGSMLSAEKYSIQVETGASLIRFIKGKGGSTLKRIEEEMGVKIIFPSSKKEGFIVIEGISADSVARASEKIQVIIDEAVNSPTLDYSHFVSLPLAVHPELVDKLVTFQNSILGNNNPNLDLDSDSSRDTSDEEDSELQSDRAPHVGVKLKAEEDNECIKVNLTTIPFISYPPKASKTSTLEEKTSTLSDLGIDKSIFIKPKTFHLTVLMLKLWNKDRVVAAAEVLQNVSSKVMDALECRPLSIRLKGLVCMRGSLAKARVLYAPVEEIGGEDRLLCVCQVIIDAFVKAGLVLEKDAQQKLKLHATLMNSRHRKRKNRTRKVDSFDARGIVEQYGSEEWGTYLIREAHLSQRFVFDENGYYRCCASIPFPENKQLD